MSTEHKSQFSTEWLTKVVREKYHETELGELVSIVSKPIGGGSVSFVCHVEKLQLVFNNKTNNKQITIHLVGKLSKGSQSLKDVSLTNNRVEIEMYLNVIAHMEELMVEFNDKRDFLWPKLYGCVPHTVLLIEDVSQGAIPVDPVDWLKGDASLAAIKGLGRYHAMSKILLQRGLIGQEYKDQYVFARKTVFQVKLYGGMLRLLSDAMIKKEGHWINVESSVEWGKRLEVLIPTFIDKREECYMNYDERFVVLNHGDFRTANMMFFGLEGDDRPAQIKLFDYQLPHTNSFVWDILYFFCLTVDPHYRREHRTDLLQAYQKSLSDSLTFFNYEGHIPTMDDVQSEIDRVSLYQFTSYVCASPLLRVREKKLTLEKVITHPPDEAMDKSVYSDKRYVNEVLGEFKWAIDHQVI